MTPEQEAAIRYQKKLAKTREGFLTLAEAKDKVIFRLIYEYEKVGKIHPQYKAEHKEQRELFSIQDVWDVRYAFARKILPLFLKEDVDEAAEIILDFWKEVCKQNIYVYLGNSVKKAVKALEGHNIPNASTWLRHLIIMQLARLGYPLPLPDIDVDEVKGIVAGEIVTEEEPVYYTDEFGREIEQPAPGEIIGYEYGVPIYQPEEDAFVGYR